LIAQCNSLEAAGEASVPVRDVLGFGA